MRAATKALSCGEGACWDQGKEALHPSVLFFLSTLRRTAGQVTLLTLVFVLSTVGSVGLSLVFCFVSLSSNVLVNGGFVRYSNPLLGDARVVWRKKKRGKVACFIIVRFCLSGMPVKGESAHD